MAWWLECLLERHEDWSVCPEPTDVPGEYGGPPATITAGGGDTESPEQAG